MRRKYRNLLLSGLFVFLAVLVANASIELWAGLPQDHGIDAVITATVNAIAIYALVSAAAYQGVRYCEKSRRGPRR